MEGLEKELLQEEIDRFKKKAFSTRLSDERLMYFLKYAQEFKTESISETFYSMIDVVMEHVNLDHVEFHGGLFSDREKKRVLRSKLLTHHEKKESEKELITLGKIKMPKRGANDVADEDGVLEI